MLIRTLNLLNTHGIHFRSLGEFKSVYDNIDNRTKLYFIIIKKDDEGNININTVDPTDIFSSMIICEHERTVTILVDGSEERIALFMTYWVNRNRLNDDKYLGKKSSSNFKHTELVIKSFDLPNTAGMHLQVAQEFANAYKKIEVNTRIWFIFINITDDNFIEISSANARDIMAVLGSCKTNHKTITVVTCGPEKQDVISLTSQVISTRLLNNKYKLK